MIQSFQVGAARAARLASQLLVLARSDHSIQGDVGMQPVDLKAVASDAASEWSRQAYDAAVDVGFELETAWVDGQRYLLRELLGNLIHNAIVHAGKGATVTVRTACDPSGTPRLVVEDDGPGIPDAQKEHVFERFYRGSEASAPGTGLGLAIVARIVATHGARIQPPRAANDRGLRVTVIFPRCEPPPDIGATRAA